MYKKILINNKIETYGKFTFDIMRINDQMQYAGQLILHEYIEELKSLESDRYKIKDIEVQQESFGSDDFFILYTFIFEEYEVKGIEERDYMSIYTEEEQKNLYPSEVEGSDK